MLVRFWKWLTDESPSQCSSCILLRDMLEAERDAKDRILRQLLQMASPPPKPEAVIPEVPIDLGRKAIPWVLRKKLLEDADRHKAELERAAKANIEKLESPSSEVTDSIAALEKELGVA